MSEKYDEYIIQHKENVQKAFNWLKEHNLIKPEALEKAEANVASHDLSKYQPEEYDAYDAYFYSQRTPEVDMAFNYAWLHHIHENPHHWQYWVLKHDDEPEEALEMPEEYIIEMIADWWSFSFKVGNLREIFSWYKKHKDMVLNRKTRGRVEDILYRIQRILDDKEMENK